VEFNLIRGIEQKLELMGVRLDAIHLDMIDLAGRMDRVIDGMVEIDTRLGRLDQRLECVERRIMEFVH
jgi:hypothetical protein